MSVDRIETLHLEASEHYLNGRFDEAIRAWKQVLALDPANEQALEGVRMSSLLGEGEAAGTAFGAPDADLDADIDAGLKVFEFDAKSEDVTGPVGDLPDPNRQAEGIDFGDIQQVEAIPLAPGEGENNVDLGVGDALAVDEETGLAPLAPNLPGSDPAMAELARRVRGLLDEAKSKAAAGDIDGALAVLARVQVLDEDNAEAAELDARLRSAADRTSGEIDRWMTEGVQAFEAGMLDEARGWFLKVLGGMPDHAEARHYMAEIGVPGAVGEEARHAPAEGDDLLSSFLSNAEPPSPPEFPSVPGHGAETGPALGGEIPVGIPPEPESEFQATPMRHRERQGPPPAAVRRAGGLKKGLLAVVGVGGCAILGGWWFLSSDGGAQTSTRQPNPVPRATVQPTPAPAATEPPTDASAAPPFGVSMSRGKAAMDRRDYEKAILAYNDALQVDPSNADARIAMAQATEAYKVTRAQREQIDRVRGAFQDGEYSSALRVIYRLPAEFDTATVNRWKVNGWFNLAVVALRAGEVPQAMQHLDEALGIQDDQDARKWKAFAQGYVNRPKDRVYYAATESIAFRSLDD